MSHSRRRFIANGLGFVSLGLTMPRFLMRAALADEAKAASTRAGKSSRILVVIEMSGGNDGLNTVVPLRDPLYAKLRPTIGIAPKDAVHIGENLGLNPGMRSLGALYEKGQVAVVTGVGYPNPNRSHFEAMDIWQSGDPTRKAERSGWLARYFDADGHFKGNPLSGIVMGDSLPLALSSFDSPVSVVGDGYSFGDGFAEPAADALAATGTMARGNADFIKNVGHDIYASTRTLKDALQKGNSRSLQDAQFPENNGLSNSLKTISRLISGGLPTRVYYASVGGFDTHANQPAQHAALLGGVSDSIAAFQRSLALSGREQDVVLMTFSEFGRRVAENGSAGTDHGAASSMFVVGAGVRGGTFGAQPALDDLDDGDLKFTTDFRTVYSALLGNWMKSDTSKVLGGTYKPLALV